MKKQKNFRFSKETEKQLINLALAEATKVKRIVTETDMLISLISRAYKRIK